MSSTGLMPRSVGFVRAWVRLYTAGLPSGLRDSRREEIDADFWDQSQEAETVQRDGPPLATHLLLRWLLGLPDDLIWRLAHIRARDVHTEEGVRTRAAGWAFRSLAVIIGLLSLVGSAGTVLGHPPTMNEADPVLGAAILLVDGLAVMWGALILARRPQAGVITLMMGAVVFGFAWQWTVILPIIGGFMVLLGLFQAYKTSKRRTVGATDFFVADEGEAG